MEYILNRDALPRILKSTYGRFDVHPYYIGDGSFQLPQDKILALHYHDTPELGICLRGSGECHIGNRVYHFKAGDIQIIRAFEPHLSNSSSGERASWRYISFNPSKVMRKVGLTDPDAALALIIDGLAFSGIFSQDEYPDLTKAIKRIAERADIKDENTDISVALAIADFFIESKRVSRRLFDENLKSEHFPEGDDYNSIRPALNLISENIDDNKKLCEKELGVSCKMSISTLRRRFLRATGMSPKTYITHMRMAYAEYLLTTTDLSVLDISMRTGYNEISGFNRVFISFFKVSPGKYRKSTP